LVAALGGCEARGDAKAQPGGGACRSTGCSSAGKGRPAYYPMNPSRRRALQLAAALALSPALARAQGSPAPAALGYLPWWMAAGWQSIGVAAFDRLVLFDAPISPDGALERRAWAKIAPGLG